MCVWGCGGGVVWGEGCASVGWRCVCEVGCGVGRGCEVGGAGVRGGWGCRFSRHLPSTDKQKFNRRSLTYHQNGMPLSSGQNTVTHP